MAWWGGRHCSVVCSSAVTLTEGSGRVRIGTVGAAGEGKARFISSHFSGEC